MALLLNMEMIRIVNWVCNVLDGFKVNISDLVVPFS